MLRAEKQLQQESMLDAQGRRILMPRKDQRHGQGKLGSELPDEPEAQSRAASKKSFRPRKKMESGNPAATRKRKQLLRRPEAKPLPLRKRCSGSGAGRLNKKAGGGSSQGQGLPGRPANRGRRETPVWNHADLEPLPADAMPRRGPGAKG